MTTTKPALPEPVAKLIAAFAIKCAYGTDEERIEAGNALESSICTAIAAAVAEARAVPEGWSISRQENGSIDIRGPGHIAVNVRGAEQSPRLIPTQVLYELAEAMLYATPSPAEQPVAAHKTQSMSDNAACGSEVSDKEQPKPAVRAEKLYDAIKEVLLHHRLSFPRDAHIGAIKALGEKWIAEAPRLENNHD